MLNEHRAARQYKLDFQRYFNSGPTDWIPFKELKRMGLRGEIKPKTLVLKEGLSHWVHASDLSEINDLLEAYKIIAAKEQEAAARASEVSKQEWLAEMDRRRTERQAKREKFGEQASQNVFSRIFNWIAGRPTSRQHRSEIVDATAVDRKTGYLYLVRLTLDGITYSKIGITTHSADTRYAGHVAVMEVVCEWELPTDQIAREIEQEILKKLGRFRAAAPDSMDGYTETFAIQHEPVLRAEAERLVGLKTGKSRQHQDLIQALTNKPRDRDLIKKAIGGGGQRLQIAFRDNEKGNVILVVTVTGLNGRWLRVFDQNGSSKLEQSIPISRIISASVVE